MLPRKRHLNKNQSSKPGSFSRPLVRDCVFPHWYAVTVRSLLWSATTAFWKTHVVLQENQSIVSAPAAKQSCSWHQITCMWTVIETAVQSQRSKIKHKVLKSLRARQKDLHFWKDQLCVRIFENTIFSPLFPVSSSEYISVHCLCGVWEKII